MNRGNSFRKLFAVFSAEARYFCKKLKFITMKRISVFLTTALFACCSTSNAQNAMAEKLYITVGSTTLTATLVDNSSAQALVDALRKAPITYEAHDYGNFEKVGDLGQSFPTNDEPITTEPCDLILYQGHNLCIYYDVNTWTFTRLGKIDNATQQELKAILGDGNCTVTLSLSDVKSDINDVKSSSATDNRKYDLQGRQISTATAGHIYIENGQKKVKISRQSFCIFAKTKENERVTFRYGSTVQRFLRL